MKLFQYCVLDKASTIQVQHGLTELKWVLYSLVMRTLIRKLFFMKILAWAAFRTWKTFLLSAKNRYCRLFYQCLYMQFIYPTVVISSIEKAANVFGVANSFLFIMYCKIWIISVINLINFSGVLNSLKLILCLSAS